VRTLWRSVRANFPSVRAKIHLCGHFLTCAVKTTSKHGKTHLATTVFRPATANFGLRRVFAHLRRASGQLRRGADDLRRLAAGLRRRFSACDGRLAVCDGFPTSCDALPATCDGNLTVCPPDGVGEKRRRAAAVQNAGARHQTFGEREASWSAPVLWRFRAARQWLDSLAGSRHCLTQQQPV
jgi:hypothetical protein